MGGDEHVEETRRPGHVASRWLGDSTCSAPPAAVAAEWQSFGCKEDTVAATSGYYATEKTCVEKRTTSPRYVPTHSVTKCKGSGGAAVRCQKINGNTVNAGLYFTTNSGTGEILYAGTAAGDADCFDCTENSHYSAGKCSDTSGLNWFGRISEIRVIFPNGVLSSTHSHTNNPVGPIEADC
jgi:hypothetical protein